MPRSRFPRRTPGLGGGSPCMHGGMGGKIGLITSYSYVADVHRVFSHLECNVRIPGITGSRVADCGARYARGTGPIRTHFAHAHKGVNWWGALAVQITYARRHAADGTRSAEKRTSCASRQAVARADRPRIDSRGANRRSTPTPLT